MSKHAAKEQEGKFCCLRAQPCNCPTNARYIDNARAKAKGWASYSFQRTVNKKTGAIVIKKKPEAHHILCTASVRDYLLNDTKILPFIGNCQWCINASVNMKPMPLWGHTIKWYHSWTKAGKVVSKDGSKIEPPFENIPQHDVDHNGKGEYRSEIDKDIKALARRIKRNIKPHKLDPQSIAGDLDALSTKWDGKLVDRGVRQGGTHTAWTNACNKKTYKWYEPFSMASTGCLKKLPFPTTFADKTSDTIDKIKKAMWG